MVQLLVTYLEMLEPPRAAPLRAPLPAARIARERPDSDSYLTLYRAVGGPWQWDQRLSLSPGDLQRFLESPSTHIFVLRLDGEAAGLCEFERVGEPDVELTNFGLVPDAQGRRLGPWLLDIALREVWSRGPRRVWLHTDTNDHPKAIATYERAGFRRYMSRMEAFA